MRFVAVACLSVAACGGSSPSSVEETRFGGTAAVRVAPLGADEWLLVLETLQPQYLVTAPIRTAAAFAQGRGLVRVYAPPSGWTLLDAVAHPSGDVSLLSVAFDPGAQYPLRALVSRFGAGAPLHHELLRLPPPQGPEEDPAFVSSLDRARLVASGEDAFALVRWANNAVQAYRLSAALDERWATFIEPPAGIGSIGIIGGGFDNFHQGDAGFFVFADVDREGNLVAAVPSREDVILQHDAFFGEGLEALVDAAGFDFGSAVVTRISPDGQRHPSAVAGFPGRLRRLLNVRVVDGAVLLVGRRKVGTDPGSWDAWLAAADLATGAPLFERTIDVQQGDMFWDVTPLGDGRLLATGSTNYTQNPQGLSVSDARDALAAVLDAEGNLVAHLALPAGPAGRGNEAISAAVSARRGTVAIAGVQNAPGTHAEVYSDAFVVVRPLDALGQ